MLFIAWCVPPYFIPQGRFAHRVRDPSVVTTFLQGRRRRPCPGSVEQLHDRRDGPDHGSHREGTVGQQLRPGEGGVLKDLQRVGAELLQLARILSMRASCSRRSTGSNSVVAAIML